MNTIFINSENSKTSDSHRLLLNLTDIINLRRSDKYVALSNLSICYTWNNIKESYKNNRFKISALTWNEEFELLYGSYLDFLIDQSFQGVNRLFVLSFENENYRTIHKKYYLPTVETKNYNVMIDGKNIFDQPVKSRVRTYDNIQKIATGQGDNYTIDCLLDCNYFNNYYKMVKIDSRKQQALDVDPKTIQQMNFTGNLDRAAGATMFCIIKEAKETILGFSQGPVKVL